MANEAEQPILRRKAGARRASLGLAEMTPTKAMRVAMAKAGDKVLKVPVALRTYTAASLMPDGLGEALPDPALILRVQGPGEAIGLAVLCPQAVAAVIEAQTLGRVTQGAAPDRKPTATDASLSRAFVERVLEGFAILAEECSGVPASEGYAVAGRCSDARIAAMALADASHAHLAAEVEFAGGAKTGTIHLVLPARPPQPKTPEAKADWSGALERAVMGSPARLEAVLCRVKLPLSQATAFKVGQVVPLARAGLDNVQMVATNGRKVMRARLGKSGAMRAVRLCIDDGTGPGARPAREMGSLTMATRPAQPSAPADLSGAAPMPMSEPEPLADLPEPLPDLPVPVPMDLPD